MFECETSLNTFLLQHLDPHREFKGTLHSRLPELWLLIDLIFGKFDYMYWQNACSVSNFSFVFWHFFSLYSVCVSSAVQQCRMNENVETCTNYLSGLAAGQSEATAGNVRDLIQALVVSTYKTCLLRIRAGTIQSLSVHYRYRNQPIRIDTVIMLYRYVWKYNFTLGFKNIKHIEFSRS